MTGPGSVHSRTLEERDLGSTGLRVSSLGMGCSRLGSRPLPGDLRDATRTVSGALEHGITFFDTADAYGRGLSERIVGRAIADRRDEVVVATKCGLLKTPASILGAWTARPAPGRARAPQRTLRTLYSSRRCFEPEYVQRAAEASLRRLRTDRIDVLLLHSPPADVLREGRFVEAMAALEAAGKIRSWGVSAYRCEDALLALDLPGLRVLEVRVDLCDTEALERVLPEAVARGVGVIARQPLGSGDLDVRRRALAGATGSPASTGVPEALTRDHLVACALQFVLRTEGVATAIVGMTTPAHAAANIDLATDEVISNDEIARVQRILCGSPGGEPR